MSKRDIEAFKGTSFECADKQNNKSSLLRALKEVPLKASITLEASIALPLFFFFFVNIMMLFNIIKVQCDMEAALHQTGNELCLYAYDERTGEDLLGIDTPAVSTVSGALSLFFVKSRIENYLGDELDNSCVTDGYSGLNLMYSRVMAGNDIVDIVVDYKVHPLIPIIGFKDFPVESRYYAHAWTGYDIGGAENVNETEEEMVYVTQSGEVYHRDINCQHLRLTTRSIEFDQLSKERSADGSRYYPCEYCGGGICGGNVFITDYGNRYHSSVNCAGLKRKIYTIPISEVGGRRPCSGCGG